MTNITKEQLTEMAPPISTPLKKRSKNLYTSMSELIRRADTEPPIQKIWGRIPEGSLGFICGPPKCGKSTLVEELAIAIACNATEFLGEKIETENRKVLLLSMEEGWRQSGPRRKLQLLKYAITPEQKELFEKNLSVADEGFPSFFISDKDWETLETIISLSGAKTIFLDSLNRVFQGAIEESKKAKEVTYKLRTIAEKLAVTFIIVHHVPKYALNTPFTIYSLAGSRVIAQECDFMIGVTKTSSDTYYIKEVVFRQERELEDCWIFKINSENRCIDVIDRKSEDEILTGLTGLVKDKRENKENQNLVHNYFKINAKANRSDLKKEFVDKAVMSDATMTNILKKLETCAVIKRTGHGEYTLIDNKLAEKGGEDAVAA